MMRFPTFSLAGNSFKLCLESRKKVRKRSEGESFKKASSCLLLLSSFVLNDTCIIYKVNELDESFLIDPIPLQFHPNNLLRFEKLFGKVVA